MTKLLTFFLPMIDVDNVTLSVLECCLAVIHKISFGLLELIFFFFGWVSFVG